MRLRPFTAVLSLSVIAGAALTGCGADEDLEPGLRPGAEGITAVIRSYARAIAAGDGAQACSLMSSTAQEELIARTGVTGNCLTAVTAISDPLSEEASAALDDMKVADISGESTARASATADIRGAGAEEAATALGGSTFSLTVADSRWGIESVQP